MTTNKLEIIVDEKGKTTVLMDGQLVSGIKKITFYHEVDEFPTHEIEFITQVAKIGD